MNLKKSCILLSQMFFITIQLLYAVACVAVSSLLSLYFFMIVMLQVAIILQLPVNLQWKRSSSSRISLRSWRDSRPSARALFMANGREREPRSREGIGSSREGIGEESGTPRTHSNTIQWIEFSWVRFVRLNSIGSKFVVRFRSIAGINRTQSTDWVRLNSIEFDFRKFDWLCREAVY